MADDEIKNVPIYGDSKPAPEQEQETTKLRDPQKIIVTTTNLNPKYRIILWLVIALIAIVLGFFVADKVFDLFHDPVIYTEKSKVDTPAEVKEMFKLKAGFNISDYQAAEIAKTVYDSTPGPNYKAPDKVVMTTGKNLEKVVEQERKNAGADVSIITPAPGETKKKEDIKPTDTIRLEQRNYQVFPKAEWGMNMYNDGSFAVDYQKQVKVFGSVAYVGTSVLYDKPSKDVKYGVRVAFPR